MAKLALGLIETIGLVAATTAADAAVKSANVSLIGYENTKGNGMITIKIEGDVGAVKAAVDAAKMAATAVGVVVSTLVIPRPAQGLEALIFSDSTVGIEKDIKKQPKELVKKVEPLIKVEIQEEIVQEAKELTELKPTKLGQPEIELPEPPKNNDDTQN